MAIFPRHRIDPALQERIDLARLDLAVTVRSAIKLYMEQCSVTYEDLAKRLSCPVARLRSALSPSDAGLSLDMLAQVAAALGAQWEFSLRPSPPSHATAPADISD